MKNKLTIHTFFVLDQKNSFAVISSSKKELHIQKEILRKCFESYIFSKTETLSFKHYKYIKNYINPKDEGHFLLKIKNVKNCLELKTVLEIKSNIFEPKTELQLFLHKNNLLNDWISGKLEGIVANIYYERSTSFGIRNQYNETKIHFDNSEEIWNIEKYFLGSFMERYGDYSKFYYRKSSRLINIKNIECNKEWLSKEKSDFS